VPKYDSPPEDRSTLERDYREAKIMKQLLAGAIVIGIVAWVIFGPR
jgi:hypothetical protein